MSDQLYFEDVTVGDALPGRTLTVDPVQMFFFSAATYNGHRIHYDRPWATEVEGYPDLVVHGPLQVAFISQLLTDWVGGGGWLVRLSVQNRGTAYAGNRIDVSGHVLARAEEPGSSLIELQVQCETEGRLLVSGTAAVSLPRRPS